MTLSFMSLITSEDGLCTQPRRETVWVKIPTAAGSVRVLRSGESGGSVVSAHSVLRGSDPD